MKKFAMAMLCTALIGLLTTSCNDSLSEVGDSIRPSTDLVTARLDSVRIQTRTVLSDPIFSRSTYTLLGDLQDPQYGHMKADFIAQLQGARGFKFSHTPKDNKIDSIKMVVSYSSWAGDSLAWLKAAVYEIKKPLPEGHYSSDLSHLIDERNLLGTKTYRAANDKGQHQVQIPLPKQLGQKFYDLSLSNPHVFDTDESFYREVLGGLYVTTTTGTGSVLSVYNNHVDIYYTYQRTFKDKSGKDSIGWDTEVETFSNTKRQILVNHFAYEGTDQLIADGQGEYSYVKAPAGVVTEVTLAKEDLQKVLLDKGKKRIVNRAAFGLDVERPSENTLLNPPTYLLLLPKDSVASFFPNNQTEQKQPRTAYLSTDYSIVSRTYQFGNIARLLSEHLERHAKEVDGQVVIDKDLTFVLLPTRRQTAGKRNQETTALDNFIFPSAAKLLIGKERKIGILTTSYN
ncbi:DUF4270 domain-containing protein [Porphyromonas crevioricanis]|uniref:DUF4270 domain-containing protein n=1 Tax=Porphyromonas crevioricanis TaxID=393921 RepID=A0AB34PFF8_9PORP|nr:DUF4270 domain-containing protein [Porphyromonas crevioricanis]KGN94946.1 hypothetical protein HQ38_05355 [Porphyromonas crevioricanis]